MRKPDLENIINTVIIIIGIVTIIFALYLINIIGNSCCVCN